jgi:hypothetical protein
VITTGQAVAEIVLLIVATIMVAAIVNVALRWFAERLGR